MNFRCMMLQYRVPSNFADFKKQLFPRRRGEPIDSENKKSCCRVNKERILERLRKGSIYGGLPTFPILALGKN